jgi:hypothetical protein
MTRKASISVSVVLLAAFALFNAGMPVYFYLCPMMNDDTPMCELSPAGADGISYTSVTPDCCAKIFVADRKTTPFLKTADSFSGPDPAFLTPIEITAVDNSPYIPADAHSSSPAGESPPLFLLHSTLLI